uniref:hypothetical protein n=1 Tax=Ningiella ruwaisensis TaxID=2364274 RepID=UPI00109FD6B1|nr:hypothetical protein [Ningiella ruwaisensis]
MLKNSALIFTAGLALILFSPSAFAFGNLKWNWHWYLIGISIASSLGAYFFVRRKPNLENTGIKILVWGIYFWVLTFIQLIIFSVAYYFFG